MTAAPKGRSRQGLQNYTCIVRCGTRLAICGETAAEIGKSKTVRYRPRVVGVHLIIRISYVVFQVSSPISSYYRISPPSACRSQGMTGNDVGQFLTPCHANKLLLIASSTRVAAVLRARLVLRRGTGFCHFGMTFWHPDRSAERCHNLASNDHPTFAFRPAVCSVSSEIARRTTG